MAKATRLPETGILAPDGRIFPWGPIQEIHTIGRYHIVEYLRDSSGVEDARDHGKTCYHPYVDGKDTNYTIGTLDSALVHAITVHRCGPNSQAARHFDLMTLGTLPGGE